jgi:hypothetical protein
VVTWKVIGADQLEVWNTDPSGNFVSSSGIVSGSSAVLQSFEPSFQQDLNGDGSIGLPAKVIESLGSTRPEQVESNYFLDPNGGSAVEPSFGGAPVEAGQFDQFGGPWAPIGAEQTASGYEVAWKITGADQYTVWFTDQSGNYISSAFDLASGSSTALQSFETSFQQDLNDDRYIGLVLDGTRAVRRLPPAVAPRPSSAARTISSMVVPAPIRSCSRGILVGTRSTFRPGVDQLEFSHSTFATVAEVLNNAQQSGSDVVIAHDPQDVVTLNNILLANLRASDFHLI